MDAGKTDIYRTEPRVEKVIKTAGSLKLGRNEKEDAKKGVTNGILLAVICGILLLIISAVFLEQIEILFGATEAVLPYGVAYGRIIVIGFPFVVISTTLCSIIRADGSPKVAMVSLLIGAMVNAGAVLILVCGKRMVFHNRQVLDIRRKL